MSKILWGVSALHHDAALCVIEKDGNNFYFRYASHSERFSRVKNDIYLSSEQIEEALAFGVPDEVFWYENSKLKKLRWLVSGYPSTAMTEPSGEAYLRPLLDSFNIPRTVNIRYGSHHKSHVHAALATMPPHLWERSNTRTLIADAIGEFQTTTVWKTPRPESKTKLVKSWRYPESLGLLYAATTALVGLKPMEEEYIVMGMAAYGSPKDEAYTLLNDSLKTNLQRGFDKKTSDALKWFTQTDIAASLQEVVLHHTKNMLLVTTPEPRFTALALGGGVALNCVNNAKLAHHFDVPTWVFPNAGDAGACIGAVMQHFPESPLLHWTPFSGTDMGRIKNVDAVIETLLQEKVCGVAHGRAEFGPRALGNRSILADPRKIEVKQRVNQYKNRQQFRPLAPMVLSGYENDYFDVSKNVRDSARYMQMVVNAKTRGKDDLPAVIHHDGTARIQIVDSFDPVYPILTAWFARTGCPVLLNTSLNVRGEPLVNSAAHAQAFERKVRIPVRLGCKA